MKNFFTLSVAALLVFVNASIWEGAVSASESGDLPENGYYAATNSFPRNTVIEITNLENERTILAMVYSGLDNPGLLVTLSQEAAEALGFESNSIGRVRMNESSDILAYAGFSGYRSDSGESFTDEGFSAGAEGEEAISEEALTDGQEGLSPECPDDTPDLAQGNEDAAEPEALIDKTELAASDIPSFIDDPLSFNFALSETTEKPPEGNGPFIDPNEMISTISPEVETPREETIHPEDLIASVTPRESTINPESVIAAIDPQTVPPAEKYIDPRYIIDSIPQDQRTGPQTVQSAATSSFSAPMIGSLEKGKYYVQIAAFSKAENVETAIAKIGRSWPLAIQSIGTADSPLYRVLVGPVNLGESNALLQRFRTIYRDAFVRVGS